MFTLQSAQDIILLITRLIAYLFVITPAGAFKSWTTKKMGDPTADELGFTSLNPIVHVDTIGLICLVLLGFGWGRQIPLIPSHIIGKYRAAKLVIASFSGVFMYLLVALISILCLAFFFGADLGSLTDTSTSSFALSIGRILIAAIGLSCFLAMIELVINGVMLTITYLSEKQVYEPRYLWYALLIAPLVILLLVGQPLQELLMKGILTIADFIARAIGISK